MNSSTLEVLDYRLKHFLSEKCSLYIGTDYFLNASISLN